MMKPPLLSFPISPRPRAWGGLCLGLIGLAIFSGCGELSEEAAPEVFEAPPTFERSQLTGFDEEIRQALEHYRVPGAVVLAVYEDHPVFWQGFGRPSEGGTQALSENSLFRIGTLTRALSSSLLATLVDEQRLDWRGGLQNGLSPSLTAALDGAGIGVPWTSSLTEPETAYGAGGASPAAEDSPHQARPPTDSLAEWLARATVVGEGTWVHGGIDAYAALIDRSLEAAGEGASEGGSENAAVFRRALQERLVGPAGMVRTAVADRLPALVEDFATPHVLTLEGEIAEIDYPPSTGVASTGVVSTAADLGRFLSVHLEEGISQSGKRVVSGTNLGTSRWPLLAVESTREAAPLAQRCCGVGGGWRTAELGDGASWVGAEGGIDGYAALIGFLPQRRLGLVVLANLEATHGGRDFAREVRDAFLARLLERAGTVSHRLTHERFLATLGRLEEGVQSASSGRLRGYYGDYEGGWSLARRRGVPMLSRGLQEFRVGSAAGNYVLVDGAWLGARLMPEEVEGDRFLRLLLLDGSERILPKLQS